MVTATVSRRLAANPGKIAAGSALALAGALLNPLPRSLPMSTIRRFFGWLFVTDCHLATLSDDAVLDRALGKRRAELYRLRDRLASIEIARMQADASREFARLGGARG